jgi:hypothetical protein
VPRSSRLSWHGRGLRTNYYASAYSTSERRARQESFVTSARAEAASEIAHLKEKSKELQFKLRQMWDWHNEEISNAGGLTFKASSLIAKALHPDTSPSEEIRLDAFKAFSAWKSDRDAAKRTKASALDLDLGVG